MAPLRWLLIGLLLLVEAPTVVAVEEHEILDRAQQTLASQFDGKAQVRSARYDGRRVELDFDAGLVDGASGRLSFAGEVALDEVWHQISDLLLERGIADAEFFTRVGGRPLEDILDPLPAPSGQPLRTAPAPGKKVALGPGHGYYFHHSLGWTLQRSYFFGIVEDFMNMDFMLEADAALEPMGFTIVHLRNFDRHAGLGESGHPKWQECARQHLKTIGAPSSVWNSPVSNTPDTQYNQDIRARPLYANHVGANLLVSLHNNAGGGTGTETLYDTGNGQQVESKRFADIVNAKIVSRIRGQYLAGWVNRGVKGFNGNYGENRIAQCPSVIIEVAFFDKESPDNEAQHDPLFHRIVGEAIADSVAEFFNQPVLTYQSHRIDDDASGESSGNGDGELDAGETVELIVTWHNGGFGAATGLRGTVAVSDPYVSVADVDTTWPNIAAGSAAASIGDLGVTISPECPRNHPFTVSLMIEGNEGTWIHVLPLVVKDAQGADLVDAGASHHSLSTTSALPGQSVTVSGRLVNAGGSSTGEFRVRFFASIDQTISPADLTLADFPVSNLAGGAGLPFNAVITLPANLPAGRYFVGWIADADNSVTELDETNNTVTIATSRLAITPPGSEVAILAFRRLIGPAAEIDVTFSTKPGYDYALERSQNLTHWERVLENFAGTGMPVTLLDRPPESGNRRFFYRVIEE